MQRQTPPGEPRSFPTTGAKLIDQDQKVEEKELSDFVADRFYPVRLGEVFQGRYQAVTKLGFGNSSTIWLARDLRYFEIPDMYDAVHLAELIATLGPPPLDFLKRNPERAADFWDNQGMFEAISD